MRAGFVISAALHEGCAQCVALADRAADLASVTGSVGATYSLVSTERVEHSVTVSRRPVTDWS